VACPRGKPLPLRDFKCSSMLMTTQNVGRSEQPRNGNHLVNKSYLSLDGTTGMQCLAITPGNQAQHHPGPTRRSSLIRDRQAEPPGNHSATSVGPETVHCVFSALKSPSEQHVSASPQVPDRRADHYMRECIFSHFRLEIVGIVIVSRDPNVLVFESKKVVLLALTLLFGTKKCYFWHYRVFSVEQKCYFWQ
jgi:hypothetical protein